MTHAFDLASSLAAVVEGRSAPWGFIRGFCAHWVRPLDSGDGWSEGDLAAAEARLGVRLPGVLREGYSLFGRRRDLTGNHDVLLGPAELSVDEAKEALVFRYENQGAASWGILLESLGEDDPAVFVRPDLADKSDERWEGWLGRLSLCLVEIVLSESLSADDEFCDFLEPDDGVVETLEDHAVRLPFPAYPTGAEPGTRWFLSGDVLLRDDGGTGILARGRTAASLDRVRDLLPGDWLNDHR
ncbi:SMI1/KNR4 family protein [Yinghuangia sp. ASG 101]|uniref:SMI1/KNR4 family protein n=1 Tax=Yinghuangia sp. ASG 101 TaxID=2896848 RepID=UPI001E31F295|nr:SMI1/KNR4 family protein [Yinghuangia sp. ASG 101]UGQ12005.1 SMI1/KNR4 family protein [Yinghuangia sp. ASG 101]